MIILVCPIAQSETHEYPLTAFSGDFGYYITSGVYFGESAFVSSVTLRITMMIEELGWYACVEAPPGQSYYCTIGVYLFGSVWKNDESQGEYCSFYAEKSQTGEITQDLILMPQPGFSDLANGDIIQIGLTFSTGGMCCPSYWKLDPEANMISAKLLIDVSDLVPTEQSTWGRIKSIYKMN